MAVQNVQEFRTVIYDIIARIIRQADEQTRTAAMAIENLNVRIQELETANTQLMAELQVSVSNAQATQVTEMLAELSRLSTELTESFNPTPSADALIVAVQDSPNIQTPEAISSVVQVGTSEVTPDAAIEEAMRAMIL